MHGAPVQSRLYRCSVYLYVVPTMCKPMFVYVCHVYTDYRRMSSLWCQLTGCGTCTLMELCVCVCPCVSCVQEDEFLVVSTDGLWDVMEPREAMAWARKELQKGLDPQQVCDTHTHTYTHTHIHTHTTPDSGRHC